jgi:ABC-2 type transport system permease protein
MTRAFAALCARDLFVWWRTDLVAFLAQALVSPALYLLVLGRVLPEVGEVREDFGASLLPGVLALALVVPALQSTVLPLAQELSGTRELEDRLLAPLPAWAVGVEKLLLATGRGIVAALCILPIAALLLPAGLDPIAWPVLLLVLPVGGLLGASAGMVLGTLVRPDRIAMVFAVVLTPLMFTGATFVPWAALGSLPGLQVATLANPLTYASEAARAAMTDGPHLGAGWIATGLAVSTAVSLVVGLRGFVRRVVL